MAFLSKVGSFSLNTITGAQVITGVGFQPKAIIFFGTGLAGAGTGPGFQYTIGAVSSAGTTHADGFAGYGADNLATQAVGRYMRPGYAIEFYDAGVEKARASVTSLDADGFTINVIVADAATSRLIFYVALGGDIQAHVDYFNIGVTTGNQSRTGAGFQPDCVMLFGTCGASTLGTTAVVFNVGVFSADAQWALSYRIRSTNPSNSRCYQRTDRCYVGLSSSSDALVTAAEKVSLDADGYTVNILTASTANVVALALKGVRVSLGAINQPTANGTQEVTTGSVSPALVLLASDNLVASTGIQTGGGASFGAATLDDNASMWFSDVHNVSPTQTDQEVSTSDAIRMSSAGVPTLNAAATVSALGPSSFTLDWGGTDAIARQVLYVALGPPGVTTTQTQTGKARITVGFTQSQTGKSRITVGRTQVQTGKSRITVVQTKTQVGTARITLPSYTFQTQTGKARITVSGVTHTQVGKAAILVSGITRTQTGKSRISVGRTQVQTGKSRVSVPRVQTQSGKARLAVVATKTQTGKARVAVSRAQTQTGTARIHVPFPAIVGLNVERWSAPR
jgi:hypothetical protein